MPAKQPTIHVLRPGLLTTIQDLGRAGYQRFGVSVSGVMDPWAFIVGNRLLGNPDHAAGHGEVRAGALSSHSELEATSCLQGDDCPHGNCQAVARGGEVCTGDGDGRGLLK